ncbi:MAG: UDP-N-acetylmuramoyl-tripeptide--D-alanyl-D-alanine ligase [Congregibacter sp.]
MMTSINLAELSSILGAVLSANASTFADAPECAGMAPIQAVEIDSRRVQSGDLFIAVPGARVDGHDFVNKAAARGAIAAVVERDVSTTLPCLKVSNSLTALTQIAAANREIFSGVLVAITGSCGKTSVKNMCRSIFRRQGITVATAGNYNNEIGVPLTLAKLNDDTQYAVVEMGATGRGDIAHLCGLARPGISTVLNAMEAHLDGFGSVADVAGIKAEIYDGLDSQGFAILNLDQPWVPLWRERIAASGARTLSYSINHEADITASSVQSLGLQGSRFTLNASGQSRSLLLPLPGQHNIANALAAAALASAAGVSFDAIVAGLSDCDAEPGRLHSETLSGGTVLIDDSYNANPGSVRAAIDLLAETPGTRTLILGEMLELGDESASKHAEMGARAKAQGIQLFVSVGEAVSPAALAFGEGAQQFPDRDSLSAALPELLEASDSILVKGSRGAAMEAVLQDLRAIAQRGASC